MLDMKPACERCQTEWTLLEYDSPGLPRGRSLDECSCGRPRGGGRYDDGKRTILVPREEAERLLSH